MATQMEIERKFHITGKFNIDSWPVSVKKSEISQFYLEQGRDGVIERVRVRSTDGEVKIVLCMKEFVSTGTNIETEVEITPAEMLMLEDRIDPKRGTVRKTRYVFDWNGLTYELDVFKSDIIKGGVLEIELGDIEESVEIPPFIKKDALTIKEVTEDVEWSNYNIAKKLAEKSDNE